MSNSGLGVLEPHSRGPFFTDEDEKPGQHQGGYGARFADETWVADTSAQVGSSG